MIRLPTLKLRPLCLRVDKTFYIFEKKTFNPMELNRGQ